MSKLAKRKQKKTLFKDTASNSTVAEDTNEQLTDTRLDELLSALESIRCGDLTNRLPVRGNGILTDISAAYNETVDSLSVFCADIADLARAAGVKCAFQKNNKIRAVEGIWQDIAENVTQMASNSERQPTSSHFTTTNSGDLPKNITVEVKGETVGRNTTPGASPDNGVCFNTTINLGFSNK